jgi:hypothetical protein
MSLENKSEATSQKGKSVKTAEGKYRSRVLDQYFGASKEKGTVSFNLALVILANCDQPEALYQQLQRELTWWITDETYVR